MPYDPAACGARCDVCILRTLRKADPVPPELHGSAVSIVTDYPGEAEVTMGRPLVGQAGLELNATLQAVGVRRDELNLHFALACQPPAGDFKRLQLAWTRENRRRKREGEDALPTVAECCQPRLVDELRGVPNIMPLGKVAYTSVVPAPHRSIDDVQGHMFDDVVVGGESRKIVPVVHPSRVLHEARWRVPFRRSVERAVRWFRGQLAWREPAIVTRPTAKWFVEVAEPWLMQQPFLCYDTETNEIEPLRATLHTLQIGTQDFVVVVAFTSKDQRGARLYSREDEVVLAESIERLLTKGPPIFGHNAGSYDRQVMWGAGYALLGRPIHVNLTGDTLLIHRHVDPELPHDLGFVGGLLTDVHDWKGDGKDPQDDATYWRYGALDVAVNARIVPPLLELATERAARTARVGVDMAPMGTTLQACPGAATSAATGDRSLYHDHQMQGVCVEMHTLGMYVNQSKRAWTEAVIRGEEAKWIDRLQTAMIDAGYADLAGWEDPDAEDPRLETARERFAYANGVERKKVKPWYCGRSGPRFNPQAGDALRTLLFDRWDLPFPSDLPKQMLMTESDDRSVADPILRAYMADMTLSEEQHKIIHAARRAKQMRSLYSRFLKRLVPYERYAAEYAAWKEKQTAKGNYSNRNSPGIVVWEDGRARFNWNAAGTGVGRLSAGGRPSRMNPQTFPDLLRAIFEPAPGHVFVNADLDAIHLKIIANVWKIPSLIDDFTFDRDPHATLAAMIFGDLFLNDPGHKSRTPDGEWRGNAKKQRGTAKSLRYAGAYGASVPTIHATMTRTQDEEGNLTNRKLKVHEVRAFYNAWMGAEPEWKTAWDKEIQRFRDYSYMLSPVLGRRADFADGEDRNKLINYRILSGEGDIMGPATVRVRNRIPPATWSPTSGIVGQFHDAILLEVPEDRAQEAAAILTENMNIAVPGWPIPITSTAKVGRNWKEV